MPTVFVVLLGGCVYYVSSEDPHIKVKVLDLDNPADPDSDAVLEYANSLVRVY